MFGDRLKLLRKNGNYTQKELGEKLNVSGRVIGYYESNERFPDKETLTRLADFFEVSVDYLLGRTDIRNNIKDNKIDINKNEKDNDIEKIIDELMEQKGLMLCGEPMSEEDMFLLRNSIRSTIELAKTMKSNKK
ncbi:MAG: helix-turn-helix transcriptional regulator [Terrisporobacter othiniensis]|uniref:helix-turn-helix domain-containing protein n=1 Tax=Terrisporobacter othiniensis TaxID=1577792 RepID=UPI00057F2865